jgi:hypothetical protein
LLPFSGLNHEANMNLPVLSNEPDKTDSLVALVLTILALAAFFLSDRLDSPSSFIRTRLEPSRVFWNVQPEECDSSFRRLKMTVFSARWGDALFSEDDHFSLRKTYPIKSF